VGVEAAKRKGATAGGMVGDSRKKQASNCWDSAETVMKESSVS